MVTYVNGCYYYAWNFTPGSGQNVHTVNGTSALCSALEFNGTNVVCFALYICACKHHFQTSRNYHTQVS